MKRTLNSKGTRLFEERPSRISGLCDPQRREISLKRLISIAFGALFSFVLLTSTMQAQGQTLPSYRIVPLPAGFSANDVNNSGQVAGCYPGASPSILHAVIYSNGILTDIGAGDNTCATAINNKGDVAGINSLGHVFFWSAAATPKLQDLGLPPHIPTSYGIVLGGMNDASQIAGGAYLGLYGSNTEGFIVQPATATAPATWTEFLAADYGILSISIHAINNLGDFAAVGAAVNYSGKGYSFGYVQHPLTPNGSYSTNGPFNHMNPLWQGCGYSGVAAVNPASINDSDEVVGSHDGYLCNLPVAFVYTPTTGVSAGGSSQYSTSGAVGVTNDGQVLENFQSVDFYGIRSPADGAISSSPGYYLTQVVRQDCGWTHLGGGRISKGATPVTPGTITPQNIIGTGINPSQPSYGAFLMTPLSSPPQTTADGCTVPPTNPTPTSVPHVSQPVVEAAGPNGASVTLDGSGSTAPNGGPLTYLWTGPFGSASGVNPTVMLPLGTSTIMLTVTDSLGHTGSASIQITVQDTTPPVLTLPANPSTQATSASGAVVTFTPTANDLVSGTVPVTCAPASGSTFAIGTTTVNCSATDAAGNTAAGTFTVTVTRLSQTISFPAIANHTYGDPDFPLSATSSSGLPLTYTTASNPYCMIIGFTVHIITAGICPITAQQAGNGNYLPAADVTLSFTINRADAVIVVTPYGVTYDGSVHTATGTATGVGGASLSGLSLTGTTHTNAGTYSDSWTFTDATGNYNNATGTVQNAIARANAVVSVTPYSVPYDGNMHTATGTATGVGGASLSGLSLTGTTHTNAGTYSTDSWTFIDPTGNYNSASGSVSDAIAAAPSTTTVSCASVTYNGAAQTPCSATATGAGGLSQTLTISYVNNVNAGTATASATFAGDANHTGSSSSANFTLNKANQVITWNAPATMTYGAPLSGTQLDATVAGASGGTAPGALTYSPASGTILSAGSNSLTVTAAATSNYNSATKSVSISVQYLSGGMCGGDVGHAILPPISADGSSVWKQGSTVPAKFRVCDVNGVSIGTAGVVKNFVLYQINSGTITAVDETAVNSTNDLAWHFDPTAQQWIFNLSTKTAPQNLANQTYYYRIDLNDGSSIYFSFGLR